MRGLCVDIASLEGVETSKGFELVVRDQVVTLPSVVHRLKSICVSRQKNGNTNSSDN